MVVQPREVLRAEVERQRVVLRAVLEEAERDGGAALWVARVADVIE